MDDDAMFEDLKKEYEENFDMTWIGKYGFNNTFTVAVRGDVADKYNLKTTSDLAAVAGDLTFGGNPDYIERQDGFPILCETYGLNFKKVMDIDIGLKYQGAFQRRYRCDQCIYYRCTACQSGQQRSDTGG